MVCLTVVSHCDDETLGPGAFLFELQQLAGTTVFVMILAATDPRRRRESERAMRLLGLERQQLLFADFPDGRLWQHEGEISELLHQVRDELQPSLVITHRADAHHDHAACCRVVHSVFGHAPGTSILHFKIAQRLALPWSPNVFVRVSRAAVRRKLRAFRCYQSQRRKHYFDETMHLGQHIEAGCSAGSRYAEAFETGQLYLAGESSGHSGLVLAMRSMKENPAASDGADLPQEGQRCLKVDRADCRVVLEPCDCGCGRVTLADLPPLLE